MTMHLNRVVLRLYIYSIRAQSAVFDNSTHNYELR